MSFLDQYVLQYPFTFQNDVYKGGNGDTSTQTHTFPNGLCLVYSKAISETSYSAIRVFCRVGSIHETDAQWGIAHFVEHLCFKGTTNHPSTQDIAEFFNTHGYYLNASTDYNHTVYKANVQTEQLEQAIQLMSEMVLDSTFSSDSILSEINVMLAEESKYPVIQPNEMKERDLYSMMFQGSAFEHLVDNASYHTSPTRLSRETLYDFYKTYYIPQNMVVSIVSTLGFDEIKTLMEKTLFVSSPSVSSAITFKQLPSSISLSITQPPPTILPYVISKNEPLTIAFLVCNQSDPDRFPLQFLRHAFSNTFFSRFYTIMREVKGLAYNTMVNADFYEHAGVFSFTFIANEDCLVDCHSRNGIIPTFFKIMNDITTTGFYETELVVFKTSFQNKMRMLKENNGAISLLNGLYSIFDLYDKIEQHFNSDYDATTLHSIFLKYFNRENMYVSIPDKDMAKHIQSFSKSFWAKHPSQTA